MRFRLDHWTLWSRRASVQSTVAALVAGVALALVLRPWSYPTDYVFTSGTDTVWQQGIFQLHAQGGVFGTSEHLAWPVGANPWRLPQLGAAIGLWAWVTVGWMSLGTATAILWYLVAGGIANAVAMVYFLRSWGSTLAPVLVIGLAVTVPCSVFFITHQLNLISIYPVPIALALLTRLPAMTGMPRRLALGGLSLVAFAAPLWWIVVLALMLPVILLAPLFRRSWDQVLSTSLLMGAVAVGAAAQTLVFLLARRGGPGVDAAREPWTANYFPGHFSDLFVAWPSASRVAPELTARLREGSSVDLSMGFPVVVTAAVALVALLALPPRRLGADPGPDVWVLGSATIVATLYWLGGGLGNLQAAIAVMAGTVSPARIWYRMIVVLAVIGAGWIAAFSVAQQRRSPVRTGWMARWPIALVLVLGLGSVTDFASFRRAMYTAPVAPQRDRDVIVALRQSTDPCPVAQFPDEAIPNGLITTGLFDPLTYRGMIPYVIAPEYRWTAGSLDVTDRRGIATLPAVLTERDLQKLELWGFCAILYDIRVGDVANDQQADLSGVVIDVDRRPDYDDGVHRLYLLDGR